MKTAAQLSRAKYAAYLRMTGRPTRVPVGPVRDYLWTLHYTYGMSAEQIAERCFMSSGSISEIIAGSRRGEHGHKYVIREVYRENAESVLAIKPEIPADRGGARINAVGTTRRIQALAAEGFPVRWIGDQCGFVGQTFYLTAQGKRKVVYYSTAHKIKCLYEKLAGNATPEDMGIPAGKANLARTYAARSGYVRSAYWDWDTIDDPDAFPDFTGFCGTLRGYQVHQETGTTACPPCKTANAAAVREYRERKRLDSDSGSKVL